MTVFRALWHEEHGFVVSTELVVVATLLVVGLMTGMRAMQATAVGEMHEVADAIGSLDQSYRITGIHTNADDGYGRRAWTQGVRFVNGVNEDSNSVDLGNVDGGAAYAMREACSPMYGTCRSMTDNSCGAMNSCCGQMNSCCGGMGSFYGASHAYGAQYGNRGCDCGPFSYTREMSYASDCGCASALPICPPRETEPPCSSCPPDGNAPMDAAVMVPACACSPCSPSQTHLIW